MSRHDTPVSTNFNIQQSRISASIAIDNEPLLLNPDNNKKEHRTEPQHNKLGTINGVYVPCLLNIMGIVLFERLSWGIGQVGVLYVVIIYLFAETAAILTVLSLSAIVTNGAMKGGGSYYMISRILGPEFGGSVGILFYCAYCVNIAFCCSGCAEEILKTWYDTDELDWSLNIFFSSCILFVCGCVALLGANVFTKVNIFLFITVFASIALSVIAAFSRSEFVLPDYTTNDEANLYIHQEWSWSQLKANFMNNCPNCYSKQSVFGVLFGGVTGLMEGANLSGDLANPSRSIPIGTLSAIGTAIIVYSLMIVSFGGSFSEFVLREVTTVPQNVSWGYFGYCLAICGVLISSSSSALCSLFGASRVLQAVARDRIFSPIFNKLGYGTKKGDEPILAVILTWIISQCLLFIGGINLIAPIATSFFCLSYGTVNLSCFLLCVSGVTNFRPQFKYYSKWSALIGLIMNIFIMFYVDFIFATISLFAEICIFVYLIYRNSHKKQCGADNDWGGVAQSIYFHQLRKYLLELGKKHMDQHSKLWRPHILLFVDNNELSLIDFCNNIKKGGLYIIGSVLNVEHQNIFQLNSIYKEWLSFINRNELKAFAQIAITPNKEQLLLGYHNLLSLSGLGAMNINTVVLPLCAFNTSDDCANSAMSLFDSPKCMKHNKYMQLLTDIVLMEKNVIITHNFENFNYNLIVSKAIQNQFNITPEESPLFSHRNILKHKPNKIVLPDTKDNKWVDVWLFVDRYSFEMDNIRGENGDDVFPMLMMQFAHILSINKKWIQTNANIRVCLVVQQQMFVDGTWSNKEKENKFYEMLEKLRLINYIKKIKTVMLPFSEAYSFKYNAWFDSTGNTVSEYMSSGDENDEDNEDELENEVYDVYDDRVMKQQRIERYYKAINNTIRCNSVETYFTFIALPEFDVGVPYDSDANDLSSLYIQSLHILTNDLPPTALVKCGQKIPVISVDI